MHFVYNSNDSLRSVATNSNFKSYTLVVNSCISWWVSLTLIQYHTWSSLALGYAEQSVQSYLSNESLHVADISLCKQRESCSYALESIRNSSRSNLNL